MRQRLLRLHALLLVAVAAAAGCQRMETAKQTLNEHGVEVHHGKVMRVFRF